MGFRAAALMILMATARIAVATCSAPVLLQSPSLPGAHNSLGIVVADFNRDGALDYAVPSTFDSTITVYLGHGDGTFAAGVSYATGGIDAQRPVSADFNGDSYPDLAVLNYTSGTVGILLNNGDGTFAAATTVPGLNVAFGLEVGKLNGDNTPDLLITSTLGVKVLYGAGNGTFPTSEMLSGLGPGNPVYATAGDLNHDGTDEVVVVYKPLYASLNELATFTRGASAFQPGVVVNSSLPAEVQRVYAVDLNNDGAADVFTIDSAKNVLVFVNNGSGTLTSPVTYALQEQPAAAVVRDINEDGVPDLIFATINGGAAAPTMFGNGDGSFQPPIPRPMTGTSSMYSIGAGDIDGDGHVDFLLADSDLQLVHVLKTYCPTRPTTTSITQSKASTLYNEIVSFTVTVTADDGGSVSGRALIFDGDHYVGPLPLDPATQSGTLYDSALTVGDHTVTARYEGSADAMSSSASLSHNVYRLPFGTPQFFSALGGSNSVLLTWVGTDDSESFEIWRMSAGTWAMIGTSIAESFTDNGVTFGKSYFYRVRAVKTGEPGTRSDFTPADAASVRYWVPVPTAGTIIQHAAMEDLRVAVNLVRAAAGLLPFSFTDPSLLGVPVKAIHMTELRTALAQAFAVAGGTVPSFSAITPNVTIVRASDLWPILQLVN